MNSTENIPTRGESQLFQDEGGHDMSVGAFLLSTDPLCRKSILKDKLSPLTD